LTSVVAGGTIASPTNARGGIMKRSLGRGFVSVSGPFALSVLLLSGCGGGGSQAAAARPSAPPATPAATKESFTPLDACSLLTKAEVEALVGKTVVEPRKEVAGNLGICSFGDPASPMVGDRRLSNLLSIDVFTGMEAGYYAGAVAQAKDAYEQTRKNADEAEAVSGLGESAYWNKPFSTLHALKGRYWLSVDVEREAGLEVAKKAMAKAVERLP
jgi:hypothetical protein